MREDEGSPGESHAPAWDDRYPSRAVLHREIDAMISALLEALIPAFQPGAIAGVMWKGSSLKPWDSPLDYVPELSDVDLHVQFAQDKPEGQPYFDQLETALDMQHRLDAGFRERVPQPVHTPRLQVIVTNVLHRKPEFVPPPGNTSRTVYGRPDPLPPADLQHSRAMSLAHMLEHEPYVRSLPGDVAEKADRFLWPVVRSMTWRVAPTGPRALELLGLPFEEAWGANRTHVYRSLHAAGERALADHYAAFYLEGWRYFLSSYNDGDAARAAIVAGVGVLESGIGLARRIGSTLGEI